MPNRQLEFFFDFGSPAAYLAWTQLPALCAQQGAELRYRPMLLGGVFQATGNHSPVTVPAKGAYVFKDFARFAQRYGVPLKPNPFFPINTITLMRIACGLQMQGGADFESYVGLAFRAIWVQSLNLNDAGVVAQALNEGGLDGGALLALSAQPEVKDRLKVDTAEAVARGVFGAPTMFVDGTMYWGQDRLDFVREALAA